MTNQWPRTQNVVSEGTVEGLVQAGTVENVYFSAPPAYRSMPGIPRQLPAGVPAALWTDRAREMEELTVLAERPGPVLVVLVGEPEVGTSALATQWIHDHADRYADGQLFADLGEQRDQTSAGDVLVSAHEIPQV